MGRPREEVGVWGLDGEMGWEQGMIGLLPLAAT